MTEFPDNIKTNPGATRSVRGLEAPLLEVFWGKGDEAKALFRECEEIIARQYGSIAVASPDPSSTKPAKPARKPRHPPPDGLKTAAQAAAKLGCSIKTLNGHVASGALRYVSLGHGKKRRRRMYADPDLDEFIANQTRKDVPCPSTRTRARHTSNLTSGGEVIAFTAQPRPRPGEPRKK
jgi:hypothetical protein